MLGYDVEEKRVESVAESGGTVSRYTTTKFEYPCFIIRPPIEMYKLTVMKAMYQNGQSYDEAESSLAINLYFEKDGVTVGLGKILPRQVRSFLKLFNNSNVTGYYEDGTELTGDYLYVLGSA